MRVENLGPQTDHLSQNTDHLGQYVDYWNSGLTKGYRQTRIEKKTPAEAAGLEVGDMIYFVAGPRLEVLARLDDTVQVAAGKTYSFTALYSTFSQWPVGERVGIYGEEPLEPGVILFKRPGILDAIWDAIGDAISSVFG